MLHILAGTQMKEAGSPLSCKEQKPALDSRSPDLLAHSATQERDVPLQCFTSLLLSHSRMAFVRQGVFL